jgi:hypothetical protein
MSSMVPVNIMAASAVPSPMVKVSPTVLASVKVPSSALKVTFTGLVPASGSDTLMAVGVPSKKMSA